MQIQLRGGRTTDDAWLKAQRASPADLPELTDEDRRDARSGSSSDEEYARRLYAEQLAESDLAETAGKVGLLVRNWLLENRIEGKVDFVKFDTLRGLFQVRVDSKESQQRVDISEDTVDDLLRSGSKMAAEAIDRLLAANFGRLFVSEGLVRLINKRASVLITDEGQTILSIYRDDGAPPGLMDVEISESEDLGLWIRVVRDTKPKLLLLRWEYILALDVTDGPDSKVIGLIGAVP